MRMDAQTESGIESNRSPRSVLFTLPIAWLLLTTVGVAQPSDDYQMFSGANPPGLIGRQQLKYGRVPAGKIQPVRMSAPAGTLISPAESGSFASDYFTPTAFGLEVGRIYRFRLSEIPRLEGVRLYPSLEIIGHLSPPEGKERDYPIPVVFAIEDLRIAAEGGFVTRVIYVEDPDATLPGMVEAEDQSYFEVSRSEDPLHVAEVLGRPVAILRIGSKSPDSGGVDHTFTFNSPSIQQYESGNRVISSPLGEQRVERRSRIQQAAMTKPIGPQPIRPAVAPVRRASDLKITPRKQSKASAQQTNQMPVPFAPPSRALFERARR